MLARARSRDASIEYQQADAATTDFANAFDLVFHVWRHVFRRSHRGISEFAQRAKARRKIAFRLLAATGGEPLDGYRGPGYCTLLTTFG